MRYILTDEKVLGNENTEIQGTEALKDFLDLYFYSRLHYRDGSGEAKFERLYEGAPIAGGIDVIAYAPSGSAPGSDRGLLERVLMDINKWNLLSFPFTISEHPVDDNGITDINRVEKGWFAKENPNADNYVLVWPNVTKQARQRYEEAVMDGYDVSMDMFTEEDFDEVEAIIVSKNEIIDYIASKGVTMDELVRYADMIRQQNKRVLRPHGLTLHYDADKPSEAVSILLTKDELKMLRKTRSYIVHRDYLEHSN